jgi:hypothetical protein
VSAYAHIEPPPPAIGIWFCPACLEWREFETDVESEKLGGRATLDCPLYCTVCQTRIDERHHVLQRDPEPPRIIDTKRMSPTERAAGVERLRLARLKLVQPDNDPEQPPSAPDDSDLQAQIRQLSDHRHGPR